MTKPPTSRIYKRSHSPIGIRERGKIISWEELQELGGIPARNGKQVCRRKQLTRPEPAQLERPIPLPLTRFEAQSPRDDQSGALAQPDTESPGKVQVQVLQQEQVKGLGRGGSLEQELKGELKGELNEPPAVAGVDYVEGQPRSGTRSSALDLVMEIHGSVDIGEAPGRAADLPGLAEAALCQKCNAPEEKSDFLICDKCQQSFHVSCLKVLREVAEKCDEWVCGTDVCNQTESDQFMPLGKVENRARDRSTWVEADG